LFVTGVLLTMTVLTVQFSRLRSGWRRQNRDLKEAMAQLAEGQQVLEANNCSGICQRGQVTISCDYHP
jgi:hypothetical protein